jgi:hypothetical protein
MALLIVVNAGGFQIRFLVTASSASTRARREAPANNLAICARGFITALRSHPRNLAQH